MSRYGEPGVACIGAVDRVRGLMKIKQILTHPGGAHKDEFLACCVLAAVHGCEIKRREPEQADLDDISVVVVDVGGEHEPSRSNFAHHQFPKDHEPICALSLVLMDLGIYEDAKNFCDWLETAERFDVTGPISTAKWLGVERDTDIVFKDAVFTFTGDFDYAPKEECEQLTEERGAVIKKYVTMKHDYVVVGSLGSSRWKHGSFGTKVEDAMRYQKKGKPIKVISEEAWVNAL